MSVRTDLHIGGTITKEQIYLLEQEIAFDLGIGYKKGILQEAPGCLELETRTNYGILEKTEHFCDKHGICYTLFHDSFEEYDASFRIVIPGGIKQHYYMNANGDPFVEATPLMQFRNAVQTITLDNAPLHVNDKDNMSQEYANHLLSGKPPMEFVLKFVDDYIPPSIPNLPPLNIEEDK